jgi:hypothetical protein
MFKGGYKLIDFKENNIVLATPTTIKGVYDAIEHNYRKPTFITGLVVDSVEKEDTFVNFEHGENVYNGLIGMTANNKVLFITITNEDAVTITENTITLA